MTLKKYHQKRDFTLTPEPKGKTPTRKNNKSASYLIQKHAASHLHYDFRIELNGVLLSWAVPKGPSLDPAVKRLAMHVEDHPLEYGTFEGIIPKGQYGGGTVMLWDRGKWISEDEDPKKAYAAGNMSFILQGEKLKGSWKLIRINKNDKTWLLIKHRDPYAKASTTYDVTKKLPNSVVSKQSLEEIAEHYSHIWGKEGATKRKKLPKAKKKLSFNLKTSAFPHFTPPQLCTLVDEPPPGDQWLHEIKFDGYRILAYKDGQKIKLISRNNRDWTPHFKSVVAEINDLPIDKVVLDGEIVILNDKHQSDFQLLQNSIKQNQGRPFIYYIFDVLYYDKYDLTELPLVERKQTLKKILPTKNHILRYSDHIVGSGNQLFNHACKMGLEGIISKLANSLYISKRTKNWLKVKCIKTQEFIICGYTPPQGSRKYFGSLYLGIYDKNKQLVYAGNVGTGFTETSLKSIYQILKQNKIDKMPFKKGPPGYTSACWVKPIQVVEVEFTEWTSDGSLRHPSFKGLRSDKPARNITLEKVAHTKNVTRKKDISR